MFEMLGALGSGVLSLIGGNQNRDAQMQIAQQNIASQREFAQHGLGWRVEDAVAHGLSPLVGAGVNPGSFSPVSVGDMSGGLGAMSQDVGRAIKSMENFDERKKRDAETATKLQLEKGSLENELLRTEIASKVARENNPGQIGPPAQVPSGMVPRGYMSFVSGERSPVRSASGFALDPDKMKVKEESAPGVQRMPLWGAIPLKTHPGRASAQDLENEYGDFAGDVLAIPNVAVDALHTMGQSGWWKNYSNFMNNDLPKYLRYYRGMRHYNEGR